MNLTKELEATTRFDFEYKGFKEWADVRDECLTPRFIDSLQNTSGYPVAINDAVTAWSLTDDKDQMWPLDVVEVSRVPVPYLSALLDSVAKSWAGDEKKPEGLAVGSGAAAS